MWPSLAYGILLTHWTPTSQMAIVSPPVNNSYGYYWRELKQRARGVKPSGRKSLAEEQVVTLLGSSWLSFNTAAES